MNIIVHYPKDPGAQAELMKRTAEAHSEAVKSYIKKQPWSSEDKKKMLEAVIKKTS